MRKLKTIAEAIRFLREKKSVDDALCYQTLGGDWEKCSTEEFLFQVEYLSLGLVNLGVKPGDKVGILAHSSPRWTIADFAILAAGGVVVPLFGNISEENFAFEVEETELKTLFIAGKEQWGTYEKHKERFTTVINLYDEACAHHAFLYSEVIEQGKALGKKDPKLFEALLDRIEEKHLATIIYTSGSTGSPKGAMLTEANIFELIDIDPFSWQPKSDRYLSLLPLAHIFARALNFIMVSWGIPVYYLRDIKKLGEACKAIMPTILVVVPRVLEKVHAKMQAQVESAPFFKRLIGRWAFRIAKEEGKRWQKAVAEKLVFEKLRAAMGGNLRLVISGGAFLSPDINRFFLSIGVPVCEGWGLTEAATVTCNRLGKQKVGTVGPPFEGMEVRIAEDGEVQVFAPIVMKGYYKKTEETKEAFTEDGWLRTGDLGTIDSDGYLTIVGRLKEVFKSSTGEGVAHIPIEQRLSAIPYIDMAMVIADKKKFASCLLFPDFEGLQSLKEIHGQADMSDEQFLHSPLFRKIMDREIEEINRHVNHWEEIHAYEVIPVTPTIIGGELTPTLKIRRDFIMKKYELLVNKMYSEEDE